MIKRLIDGLAKLRFIPAVTATILAIISFGGFPSIIEAHTEGKMQLASAPAGPYRLTVWTSPDPAEIGELHVALAVVTDEDASPVLDARVLVELVPEGQGEALISLATTDDSENKFLYEAVFDVVDPGRYVVNLIVQGEEGVGSGVAFDLDVEGSSGFNWLYLIPIVLIVAAAGLLWYALRRPTEDPN